MKKEILSLIIELVIDIILKVVAEKEQIASDMESLKKQVKNDTWLADNVRKAYPTLSDEKIISDLC